MLLTGSQAEATLGRLLLEGRKEVRIQGETIRVAAQIREIRDYSGHADAPELLAWLKARGPVTGGVFLVHGEEPAMDALAQRIAAEGLADAGHMLMPVLDERFLLPKAAKPVRQDAPRRRSDPALAGRPDWHNARAALLLGIEDAIDRASDPASRDRLIAALRTALESNRQSGR